MLGIQQARKLLTRFIHVNKLPIKFGFTQPNYSPSEDYIKNVMRNWAVDYVHGQGLCPFAGAVLKGNGTFYTVLTSNDDTEEFRWKDLCEKTISECLKLMPEEKSTTSSAKDASESFHKTTLIAFPQLKIFEDFLVLSNAIEEYLAESELDEYVQIATFHPQYRFENTSTIDVGNWSNRAPYPILHILRVQDVSHAIEHYPGDLDDIWKSNIRNLENLGEIKIRRIMENILEKSK